MAIKIHLSASLNEAVTHYCKHVRPNAPSAVTTSQYNRASLFTTSGQGSEQWLVTNGAAGRWLAHEFAERDGIFAGQGVDFVAAYLWKLIGRATPKLPSVSPFEPTITVWAIRDWLDQLSPSQLQPGGFAAELGPRLQGMLARERFEFAAFIARLYDRYLIERLDWLANWQTGKLLGLGAHEAWQAQLWRFLLTRLPAVQERHPFEWLHQASAHTLQLPNRIVVFGTNQLPLLYWEALVQLASHCDLQVYSFIVCDEFHADLVSQVTQWKMQLRQDSEGSQHYLEVGHPLLASWGYGLAAEQDRIVSTTQRWPETELSESSVLSLIQQRKPSVLRQLQCSIAALDSGPLTKSNHDNSIRILGATGLTRQLSYAQTCLVEAFEADPELRPSDVLVLCTDLTAVSQLIDGLWDQVPFRCVAASSQSNDWSRCFEKWLNAISRPLTITHIEELLEEPFIQSIFGLSSQEALDFVSALNLAGARHLRVDGAQKFSLENAIERLLLGVTVEPVFESMDIPIQLQTQTQGDWKRWAVSHITEDTLSSFSKGLHFLDALETYRLKADRNASLPYWLSLFRELVAFLTGLFTQRGAFIEFEIQTEGQSLIRTSLERLEQHALLSSVKTDLDAVTAVSALSEHLKASSNILNPSGSVLIADASDFFPSEFKHVLWIGCDDGLWPRAQPWHRLDLMSSVPRRTDLNRRTNDRAIFLKSLMLAQNSFWVFYCAREQRSGSELNPAPLVTELLQVIEGLKVETIGLLSPSWTVEAPKFSDRINDFAWWSFQSVSSTAPLVIASQDTLKQFLNHPSRYWAQKIAQMRALWEDERITAELPWGLTKKEARRILLEQRGFAGLSDHPALPAGALGQVTQNDLLEYHREFELIRANWQLQCAESGWELFITDAWYLRSIIPAIFSWINDGKPRLIYCHETRTQRLLGKNASHAACLAELEQLFALHIQAPQPFFARSFAAWLEMPHNKDSPQTIKVAYGDSQASQSEGNYGGLSDVDDRWNQLVWRGQMPSLDSIVALLENQLPSWNKLLEKLGDISSDARAQE